MNRYWIVAAALALGGCISFGPKAPPSLLTISPDSKLPANTTRTAQSGQTIVIAVPATPQAIATNRVAVASGSTEIAYIKQAIWVEAPARLFQRLLAETVAVKTGKVVIDAKANSSDSALLLGGTLLRFDIDADTNEAIIVYDALLVRAKGSAPTARRFEARTAVSEVAASPAGKALNIAANKLAVDVAAWVSSE